MKCLSIGVLCSIGVTTVVFLVCDILRLVPTPLTPYGMTHWIPELIGMFLIGRWMVVRMKKTTTYIIVGFAFLYPILTYALTYQVSFGVGTASLFVAVLLMGIWSGAKVKEVA